MPMPRGIGSRKSVRTPLVADISVRRAGLHNFQVRIDDLSPDGCKIEFVDRPSLDERVWVKFDGLESMEGSICWVNGYAAGIRFNSPIHAAVFDALLTRLR